MRTPRMPRAPAGVSEVPVRRVRTIEPSYDRLDLLYKNLVGLHSQFDLGPSGDLYKHDESSFKDLTDLRITRQKMIAVFMDILLLQDSDEHIFLQEEDVFISRHSDLRFVSGSRFAFSASLTGGVWLPQASERESESIRYIVESLDLKDDFKGSWLSRAGSSAFWTDVVQSRERDAKKRLSTFFTLLDSWQLLKQLKALDRVQKVEYLEFCWRLEALSERVSEDLTLNRKTLINCELFLKQTPESVREAILSTSCIYNKFVFVKD